MSTGVGAVFIGRDAALDAIVAGSRAERSGASIVCVTGPAGIGKTRTVEEFDRRSSATEVIWARCWEGPGAPSLWPWSQVLSAIGSDVESVGGDLAAPDRFLLYEAITEMLAENVGEGFVIVLDDIHWADAASLELLHFVGRSPAARSLSIIATYRENDASVGPSSGSIAAIERGATIVPLTGLELHEVRSFVEATGRTVDDRVVAELGERTTGNPFFLGELLRFAPASESTTVEEWRGSLSSATPSGLRLAVEQHLGLAGREARPVLELAAVQGRTFSADVIRSSGSVEPDAVEGALAAAIDAGLVAADGSSHQFEHALIADVLVSSLAPEESAAAHHAVATGLLAAPSSTSIAYEQVADHLLAAGSLAEPDLLVRAAREAAAAASSRLAWEDESHHLATVAHGLRSQRPVPEADLVDALVRRCVAEKQSRRLDAAKAIAVEAAALAERLDDPVALAKVAIEFPPDAEAIDIDDIADSDQREIRERAMAALDRAGGPPEWVCRVQAALALSLYWDNSTGDRATSSRGNAGRRDQLTADAVSTARAMGDAESLAIALHARLFANFGPDFARAEWVDLSEELVTVAARLGIPQLGLAGRYARIAELLEVGRVERAASEIEAYDREAERIGSRIDRWVALRWRSNLALLRGDLDRADELTMAAFELGSQLMPEEVAFDYVTSMSGPGLYLRCGLADHLPLFQENSDSTENIPAWRIGIAFIAAEADRFDLARPELHACCADDLAMLPRDLNFTGVLVPAALTAFRLRDATCAAIIERHLRPLSGRLAMHGPGYTSYGPYDLAIGQCLHAMGRLVEAVSFYEAGIGQAASVGSPYGLVHRMHLGVALHELGSPRAVEELEAAVADLEAAGLDGMRDRAMAELERVRRATTVHLAEDVAWTLWVGENGTPLSPLKGYRALRTLLAAPDRDVHALELAAAIEGHTGVLRESVGDDPLLDSVAIAQFRARLGDLRRRLELADRRGDPQESAAAQSEVDEIMDALADAQGYAGRSATMRSNTDRARVNVTKHLRRAIDRIADVDAALGAHLASAVDTGIYCRYSPGRSGYRWIERAPA